MRKLFIDAVYLVALNCPDDQWYEDAVAVTRQLGQVRLVTTQEVLSEFLALMGRAGRNTRAAAVNVVRDILTDPDTEVMPQSAESFEFGLSLYTARLDKSYSLVDCISMVWMKNLQIHEILTNDRHFHQEGFQPLMRLAD
jgi:predicted nucleic acid-binding protein